ncbi:MAG: type II secretion system protein GspL [Steroidobacteraceae bacterium]
MATTDWLLLRIPPQGDAEVTWALTDASGQLLSLPSADTGGDLRAVAVGKRVALLVPGAEVSQFQIALPAGNDAKLLQLAPFALEEQVSQDVEQLHFAVGRRDAATGVVPVAVVDRSQMQDWLARAAQLQLVPHAVFSESDLAPVLPGHVTMLIADDQLLLRNDAARPLLLPANDPALALEMLLGSTADLAAVHLAVYSTAEDWERHGNAVEALRDRLASLNVQLSSGGLLAQFAQGLAHASPINLLQGNFRPQRAGGAAWLQWRAAAMLAGVLLLLHGAGSFWELHQLRAAADKARQDMAKLFEAIYPGQSPGAQPRRALQKRLESLSGDANRPGELLHLLAAVAAAKQNVPIALLQSATFEPGSLKLKLGTPDAATLEQFSQALRASGYKAQVTSGSVRGGNYEGLVEVKSSGS